MKNLTVILLFCLWSPLSTFAQNQFGERATIGASLTYIPDTEEQTYINVFHEYTFNLNVSTPLTQRLSLGLSNLFIRTNQNDIRAKHNIFGAFLQYDAWQNRKNRFYLESGLFLGDYCTCGEEQPYRENGLKYVNFGGGYEWQFSPRFNLELGFLVYQILNNIEDKYGYTQYVVGLNYTLGNPKYKK